MQFNQMGESTIGKLGVALGMLSMQVRDEDWSQSRLQPPLQTHLPIVNSHGRLASSSLAKQVTCASRR